MLNKIIAMVKFNNGEAIVLENETELKYTKYGSDTIIGTDGCFITCYRYETPDENWKAFSGRKFDLPLTDGTIEHCYGQWWDAITETARKIINDKIIRVTACDIKSLKECYVFYGYYAKKTDIENLRSGYTGKIYDYWEYDKLLKNGINHVK